MESILVVGAGLSGAVIARRLADKYNVNSDTDNSNK